jgi:aminoglycoside 6'-N-acetyltransferase
VDGLPTLTGTRLTLRQCAEDELDALFVVRCDETVVRWWGAPDRSELDNEALGGDDDVRLFVIDVAGEIAGAIQYFEEPGLAFRYAAIDIFLGEPWQGQGLGREAIEVLIAHLFTDRDHRRLTIDPASANTGAVRCYASCGFREVGTLREYQRMDDGTLLDATLMELLRSDWTPAMKPA